MFAIYRIEAVCHLNYITDDWVTMLSSLSVVTTEHALSRTAAIHIVTTTGISSAEKQEIDFWRPFLRSIRIKIRLVKKVFRREITGGRGDVVLFIKKLRKGKL